MVCCAVLLSLGANIFKGAQTVRQCGGFQAADGVIPPPLMFQREEGPDDTKTVFGSRGKRQHW